MHARPTIVSTFVAPKLLICGENIFYASWLTMRESRILRESKPIFSSVKNHFLKLHYTFHVKELNIFWQQNQEYNELLYKLD